MTFKTYLQYNSLLTFQRFKTWSFIYVQIHFVLFHLAQAGLTLAV